VKLGAFLSLAGALLVLGGAASAQSIDITVDENGHGFFFNSGINFGAVLTGSIQPDAGPGGSFGLTYNLLNPPGFVFGDLLLFEPGSPTLSDWIRFNPAGGGTLVFYSDNDGIPDSLADTMAFPTDFYSNTVVRTEVGPEGSNGFDYMPTTGQPGFVAGAAFPVIYHIKSDVTPEFGSVVSLGGLLAAGGAGLWVRRRRNGKPNAKAK